MLQNMKYMYIVHQFLTICILYIFEEFVKNLNDIIMSQVSLNIFL